MNKFTDGEELFHKATRKRCVVIKTNDDGTVKVRTEEDKISDYYPQELFTPIRGVYGR